MKVAYSSILELPKRANKKADVKKVSFHPTEPYAFLATDEDVLVYDVGTAALCGRLGTAGGEVVDICATPADSLVAAFLNINEELFLQVWNTQHKVAKSLTNISRLVSPKKPIIVGSHPSLPKLFFTQSGLKTIHSIDISSGASTRFESRRGIVSLATHPAKPWVACVHDDKTIKIYNANSGAVLHTLDASPVPAEFANSKDKKEVSAPSFVAFHPSKDILIAACPNGIVYAWDIPAKDQFLGVKSIFTTPNTINYFGFHPTLPYILVLDKDAALTPWHFFAVKDKFIIPSEVNEDPIRPVHVEMENRNKHLPEYIKIPTESLSMCEMRVHGRFNFISFIFKKQGKTSLEELKFANILDTTRYGIFSLRSSIIPSNMIVPQQNPSNFFFEPELNDKGKPVFLFPNEAYLLDGHSIIAYSATYNDTSLAKQLPIQDMTFNDSNTTLFRPFKIVHSPIRDRFLVLWEAVCPKGITETFCAVVTKDKDVSQIIPVASAKDAAWVGPEHNKFIVLSDNGKSVEVLPFDIASMSMAKPTPLSFHMVGVYSTPFENGNVVLFHDAKRSRLVASNPRSIAGESPKFRVSRNRLLTLLPDEFIVQIQWQYTPKAMDPDDFYGAILTTKALRIVDNTLRPIVEVKTTSLISCLWVGMTLLYTTSTHLMYITLKGEEHTLLSLQMPKEVLLSTTCDRVVTATQCSGQTVVVTHAVGLLEPLILGLSDLVDVHPTIIRKEVIPWMRKAAECFDARRVSLTLIDTLLGIGEDELALRLLVANQQFLRQRHSMAFKLALKLRHVHTAHAILSQPWAKLVMSPESHRRRYNKVATFSMRLGQFGLAMKCFDAISDYPSMLYLCLLTKSASATQHLLNRLKKESSQAFESLRGLVQMQLTSMTDHRRTSGSVRERADSTGSNASTIDIGTPPDPHSIDDSYTSEFSVATAVAAPSSGSPANIAVTASPAPPAPTPPPAPIVVNLDDASAAGSLEEDYLPPPPPPPAYDLESSGSATSTASYLESPIFEASPLGNQGHEGLKHSTGNIIGRAAKAAAAVAERKRLTDQIQDLNIISERQKATWRLELETRVACEMRTLPLVRGSGNHVIGPLLINRLLSDWFARQISFFQIPAVLLSEEYKRRSQAENLEALSEQRKLIKAETTAPAGAVAGAVSGAVQSSTDPDLSATGTRFRRTFTLTGMSPVAVPGAPSSAAAAANAKIPAPLPPGSTDALRKSQTADPKVPPAPVPAASAGAGKLSMLPNRFRASTASVVRVSGNDPISPRGIPPPLSPVDVPARSFSSSDGMPMPSGAAVGSADGSNELLSLPPLEQFKLAIFRMERGELAGALHDMSVCAQLLASTATKHTELQPKKLALLGRYKVFLNIFIEMKKEEDSPNPNAKRVAMLVSYLSRQALLARHKLLVLRQAARRNFDLGNYGTAAQYFEQLVKHRIPDAEKVLEKIQACKEKELKDADPLPPSFKICFKTLKTITGPHKACKLCDAAFCDDAIAITGFCLACLQRDVLIQVVATD